MFKLLNALTSARSVATATVFGAASATCFWTVQNNRTFSMSASEKPMVISPKEFRGLRLMEVSRETHNTKRFRFSTGDLTTPLNMEVASCLVTKAEIDGKTVVRPYTPVTTLDTPGFFDLVVKEYPDGKMSKYIHAMNPGDHLEFKGPFQKYKMEPNKKKAIGMVAGGTGITPMIQVIQYILNNPEDQTKIVLLYANQTEKDIIMKDTLDLWSMVHSDQFKVHYILDKPPARWSNFSGYITKDTLSSVMPAPSDDNLIMVCGPPPFMNAISGDKNEDKSQGKLSGALKELNYTEDQVYKF